MKESLSGNTYIATTRLTSRKSIPGSRDVISFCVELVNDELYLRTEDSSNLQKDNPTSFFPYRGVESEIHTSNNF